MRKRRSAHVLMLDECREDSYDAAGGLHQFHTVQIGVEDLRISRRDCCEDQSGGDSSKDVEPRHWSIQKYKRGIPPTCTSGRPSVMNNIAIKIYCMEGIAGGRKLADL